MTSLLLWSTPLFNPTASGVQGCFHGMTSLMTSSVWLQATGVQASLQYEVGGEGDPTISVIPRGRDKSGKTKWTCLGLEVSGKVLVEVTYYHPVEGSRGNASTGYQCLRFGVPSKGVLRLYKTELKASKDEVHCGTDQYTKDPSVLVAANDLPPTPCPLQGSFQAILQNPQETSAISLSGPTTTTCQAKIHFNCHNENVLVTFGSGCKPPVYKYNSNKVRYHSATHLRCLGSWDLRGNDDDHSKVVVLRTNNEVTSSSSSSLFGVWCLHYKNLNGSGENVQAYLSFDGQCASTDPFSSNTINVFSKDTMYGHLANFVPARDTRCYDKFYVNQCKSRTTNCSETNACPGECGRCYSIPKPDACQFMPETVGKWEVVDSTEKFWVKINKTGFETSRHGKFSCRYSDETRMFYTNPVMQYDKNNPVCMPLYACMQIFSLAPGVSTFYLRQTVSKSGGDISGNNELATCTENNELFKEHPVPEGEMVTLIDRSNWKPTPCDFGPETLFPTSREPCLFNVTECSGKSCLTLNVSINNYTCSDNLPIFQIAEVHRCFASLKFQDGIRGLLTFSDQLKKSFCWIFTSTRLFVTEPKMCNNEAVGRVFSDKHASTKYDPIDALTLPLKYALASCDSIVPHLYLYFISLMFCLVFSVKSPL